VASTTTGIFGTAVATMGMLMSAAYILAMDTFGPITDNAGGITEFSGAPESARHITDSLDAVGNTTKALTKGYAVASAGLAAFLLFSAFLDKVKERLEIPLTSELPIDIANVDVFVGALLGVMLVFLFSSLAIRSVGKVGGAIIEEVRRQFREDPGIMAGTSRPDYARAVDITAKASLKAMIAPGLLAVGMPVLVGLVFRYVVSEFHVAGFSVGGEEVANSSGWLAVSGLLIVGTIGGIILATFLNNSGGAWDNAKKYIEAGSMKDDAGATIGKATPTHAAAVVGDTVGDPFKDTAGPALHVLVKLLSTITLVLAPLFIA
jgi:K(+)-stimulated pyrophosphate-energized sodium pump